MSSVNKGQSKKGSLKEAISNTIVGMLLSFVFSYPIFYLNGVEPKVIQNLSIVFWFTLISVGRNYVVRRWFNKKQKDE